MKPVGNRSSLRTRSKRPDGTLLIDKAGRFLLTKGDINLDTFSQAHAGRLAELGIAAQTGLQEKVIEFRAAQRKVTSSELEYLILVPTLRCNLACSYCQVSRVAEAARGFDWDEQITSEVVKLVSRLSVRSAKIEFQGGEPTLRPDLMQKVIQAAPATVDVTYVICTNLQEISPEVLEIFDRPDVQISTSLDGGFETHNRQRQQDIGRTDQFLENLQFILARYGPSKVSALPTIDQSNPPAIPDLIENYAKLGMRSIYLRPINYQGFARKQHAHSKEKSAKWYDYHSNFVRELIRRNWEERSEQPMEETYFSHLLRRVFRPSENSHVDIRSPNPIGRDYVVIDYDGQAYPSDEARMLTRSKIVDLSIGDIFDGWDTHERAQLEAAATNTGDPDCESCAYQPYCGRDIFDDLSRYGTLSIRRTETEFCRRHLHLFDLAFELIYSEDEPTQYSLRKWLGLSGNKTKLGTVL